MPGAIAFALFVAACSSGSTDGASSRPSTSTTEADGSANAPAELSFPGATWETTSPKAAGMDPAKLDEIAKEAERDGSTCLAVFRDGKLVRDWNWKGTDENTAAQTWSVTKSFTSTLVGMAQDAGKLHLHDRASTYIPEWAGTPSAGVTVENLISNDSARHFDLGFDNGDFVRAADQTALGISLGQDAPPGTVWAYNNAAIQTLDRVLERATGESAATYAQRKLLDPIGMAHSRMTKDRAGNTKMYMGLESTCLDMGRFGLLYLNHGNWDGKQIVSKAFVHDATGKPSTDLNAAYGYLFWLNRRGKIAGARTPATAGLDDGRPVTQVAGGAPADMYWAAGIGGQTIQVDPGSRTVVTRLGPAVHPGLPEFGRGRAARVVTEAIIED